MRFRPTVVVLAAGGARRSPMARTAHTARTSRTARPTLEQPLAAGTVLGSTVRQALLSQLPVLVVTISARLPLVAGLVAARDILVLPPEMAARGLGQAIASGVAERSGAPGWLMLPGDMPLVRPQSIAAVGRALEQHAVVYAQYRGRRGHPVGFAAGLYSELVQLASDEGARRLVARYPAHGEELDDPGVLLDVDGFGDLDASGVLSAAAPATGAAVAVVGTGEGAADGDRVQAPPGS